MRNENKYRANYLLMAFHSFLIFTVLVLIVDRSGVSLEFYLTLSIFVFVATFFAIYLMPVSVTDEQLTGFDRWKNKKSIAWGDIKVIDPFRFLGLKYIRVSKDYNDRPIFLPLFLADQEGFLEDVKFRAGEDSLIFRSLNEQL